MTCDQIISHIFSYKSHCFFTKQNAMFWNAQWTRWNLHSSWEIDDSVDRKLFKT